MNSPFSISRRRAIQTLFCSSAALALNLRTGGCREVSPDGLNFLCIGDFGTGGRHQKRVASAMRDFVARHRLAPDALFCIGDNFYSKDKSPGGFCTDSPRWKTDIEHMYPVSSFPGPMSG